MLLETWIIYVIAVVGLSFAPGPNGLLALTHGALYGHKKTLFTIGGGILGFTGVIALCMFGISALLLSSASLLSIMKWAGGTYLVWMGFQIWRSPAIQLQPLESVAFITHFSLFRQGLLAAISNPKVLLFFSAFLPQFINLEQPIFPQFLVMAATFAVAEFLVEYLISRVASKLRPWLERSGKHFNRGCGGVFALIGIALPLAQ